MQIITCEHVLYVQFVSLLSVMVPKCMHQIPVEFFHCIQMQVNVRTGTLMVLPVINLYHKMCFEQLIQRIKTIIGYLFAY